MCLLHKVVHQMCHQTVEAFGHLRCDTGWSDMEVLRWAEGMIHCPRQGLYTLIMVTVLVLTSYLAVYTAFLLYVYILV